MATRLSGIIYRVASVRRANPDDLIAGVGSQLTGGRWTPPGAFRAVYGYGNDSRQNGPLSSPLLHNRTSARAGSVLALSRLGGPGDG